MSLATNEWRKDGDDFIEITQWHQCVIWDSRLADKAAKAQKGQKVMLQGMVKYRSYEKDGVTRYATDIEVPRFTGQFSIIDKTTNGSAVEISPAPVTAADLNDDVPF
jgi:single-strand DNA-binding protein